LALEVGLKANPMKKSLIFFLLIFILLQFLSFPANSQKPVLMVPEGHTGYIYSVQYSPDSRSVLTASADQTAKRWDVKTGKLLNSYDGHSDMVENATFNPDGTIIATGSDDDTVKVWESKSGMLLYSLGGNYPEFSPDGKFIALTNGDHTVLLLEAQTGRILRTLKGHKAWIRSIRFSPDSKLILTACDDNTAKIWNTQTGKQVFDLKGHTDIVWGAQFSPDGHSALTVSEDKTARLWSVSTGKIIATLPDATYKNGIAVFSPDGLKLITANMSKAIKIWDNQGNAILTLNGHRNEIESASFNTDGSRIISSDWANTIIWDGRDGKILKTLPGSRGSFSPDGSTIITYRQKSLNVWDAVHYKKLAIMQGYAEHVYSASISPAEGNLLMVSEDHKARILDGSNGKIMYVLNDAGYDAIYNNDGSMIVTTSVRHSINLWDALKGTLIDSLKGNTGMTWSINFSPDGKKVINASEDHTARIWDIETRKLEQTIRHEEEVTEAVFSHDNKYVITGTSKNTVSAYDLGGKRLFSLDDVNTRVENSISPDSRFIVLGGMENVNEIREISTGNISKTFNKLWSFESVSAVYSPDGNRIVTISGDGTTDIWDIQSQKLLYTLNRKSEKYSSVYFSPDGSSFITTSNSKDADMWYTGNGKLIRSFDLHKGTISNISWSDSVMVSTFNAKITFFDLKKGAELLSVVAIDSADWVVLHPSGLFDASPGALEKMYYVQGDEIISLSQLKERFFEPGLWAKVMGYNKDPLRDVSGFEKINPAPAVNLAVKDDVLEIALENRGGGIGKFQVLINGKEVYTGNTSESETKFRGGTNLKSTFSLKGHPFLLPGKENEISVRAFNEENYLTSRVENISYSGNTALISEAPRLFIMSFGISDYTGDALDLKYAAKDAEEMAKALTIGASNLFGAKKTFTYKLTTNEPDKGSWPTKDNIKKAFAGVSKEAKASDVLIVYLSGHGINWGGQDGDFYYLTQDAYSSNSDAYNDPAIRDKTTISSAELTELIKSVAALKEVLIIDACASGRAVENLMEKRDVSSTTLRALDRMKDRTGLHIITGCAADAVSYEVSRFAQGVLTYSLLEGIKGASLREEKFIDVSKLFQYSSERVPQLARGLGGIQQPQIFSPYGEASFDIGEINANDKPMIPLARTRPVVLMSSLKDKDSFDDEIGIEKLVDEKLRELSAGPGDPELIFIEAKEFPDAYRIRGAYSITGNTAEVTVNIFLGSNKAGSFVLKGDKTSLGPLSESIVGKAREIIK
jgi:WD40 repeat protein